MTIQVAAHIGSKGAFQAIRHKGHKFDADGNIVEFGEVIEQTELSPNLMTKLGFDYLLGRGGAPGNDVVFACDTVNSDFTEDDTVMGAANGYSTNQPTQFVLSQMVASNTNPANGPLFRTIRHRRSFQPGAFGASAVNLTRAGVICMTWNYTNANARVGWLLAGARFKDTGGNPVTISVQPDEFLDVVWDHTEFYEYDATGAFVIETDGVPVDYTYKVRPASMFSNGSSANDYASWGGLSTVNNSMSPNIAFGSRAVPSNGGTSYRTVTLNRYSSGLSVVTERPTGALLSAANSSPSVLTANSLVNGSKQRSYKMQWPLARANEPTGLNIFLMGFSQGGDWQFEITPPIVKNNTKQLELTLQLSMSNV